MSDAQEPVIDYGRSHRRFGRRTWLTLAMIAAVVVFVVMNWSALQSSVTRFARYRALFHAPPAAGTLVLSSADGVYATAADVFGMPRLQAWTRPLRHVDVDLFNLDAARPANSTGDPGRAFVGLLRTASGHERLVALGCNTMGVNDLSVATVSLHVQLYDPGTYRTLAIRTVPVRPPTTRSAYDGDLYPAFSWVTFNPVRYKPGTPVAFGVPAVATDDSATLRLPITIDGVDDALRFTLTDGDAVGVVRESGGALPIRAGLK